MEPYGRVLRARLPDELCECVVQHLCAARIQTAWSRWWHYAHARQPAWDALRSALGRATWMRLIPYAHVRREWRQEMDSWLSIDDTGLLDLVLREAREGLWGTPSPRLTQIAGDV